MDADPIGAQDFARDGGVRGVDALREGEVALCILVTVVDDGRVGKGGQVREGGVHLAASALEEAAAACDEEGVAGEDAARMYPSLVSGMVADRVLRVAWCREAAGSAPSAAG